VTAGTSPGSSNSRMNRRAFFDGGRMRHMSVRDLNRLDLQSELFRARGHSSEPRKRGISLVPMVLGLWSRRRPFDRLARGARERSLSITRKRKEPMALNHRPLTSHIETSSTRGYIRALNSCQTKTFPATQAGITTEAGTVFQQPNRAGR